MKNVINLALSGLLAGGLLGVVLASAMYPDHTSSQLWLAFGGLVVVLWWSWGYIEPLQGRSRFWVLAWVLCALVGGGLACFVEYEHQASSQTDAFIRQYEQAVQGSHVANALLPVDCQQAKLGAGMLVASSIRWTEVDKMYVKQKILGLASCLGDKVVFDLTRQLQINPTYQWSGSFMRPLDATREAQMKDRMAIRHKEWCVAKKLPKCHLQGDDVLLNATDYPN